MAALLAGLFVVAYVAASEYHQSICVGGRIHTGWSFATLLRTNYNGRYNLINNDKLPTYYSNDLGQYLYPITTANISYYPTLESEPDEILKSSNLTFYFLSKNINNANQSNPHCLFNTTIYNGTFDLSELCTDWMAIDVYNPDTANTYTFHDRTFTTYQCPNNVSCLKISNAYHKFVDGTYKFSHWNYTFRGAVYHCSECDNNGGMYLYPWASSDQYYYQIDDKFTDSFAYQWCNLDENDKYIFNVDDCKEIWRYYHDDWYHDPDISIEHQACHDYAESKPTDSSNKITLFSVIGALLVVICVCLIVCKYCSGKGNNCCRKRKPKRSLYCKPGILQEEFELFKQQEMDTIFKDWDESKIDWTFNDDQMHVKKTTLPPVSTNSVIVNAYVSVEKGLKECFIDNWTVRLAKFKSESITDETLKLIQSLDEETQNKYLKKVLPSIGDLLKFKEWLSLQNNLCQVEGM